MRRQDLDRDVPPQLGVARAIDLAHAAGAERRDDRVRAELTVSHLREGREGRRGFLEKRTCRAFKAQQRLNFRPQRHILTAGFRQERVAFLRRTA